MEDDLIRKIRSTVGKENDLEEADVRSLMILIRKLLDKMQEAEQRPFLVIRLFSNWAAHIAITQSNTGLRILSAINSALVSIKNSTDIIYMQTQMSEAIGFTALRKEMKSFLGRIGVNDSLFANDRVWAVFVIHLIEIIRDVPISFPDLSSLDNTKRKIYEEISQNPIKPGAGVVAVQISQVDYAALGAPEIGTRMCLHIRTADTTTIAIPLAIDVRV
jgi:hypothetical protein